MSAVAASPVMSGDASVRHARVLLVHEWLYTWAGAERCLEEMLSIVPNADVLVGVVTPEMRKRHPVARRAMETWVGRIPGARRRHRWFLPLHALAFRQFDTSRYDLVISLSHAFEKLVRARSGRHLCYCFSPPRYLWDLRAEYEHHGSWPQRLAIRVASRPLRAIDRAGAAGVDRFVCISRTVADRVRRCYGRDSDVVYPAVSAKPDGGTTAPRGDFLLSLGRLVPYKRVDLAIAAAEQLRMRLVVAGDGPERTRLERLAGPKVDFVGSISEEQAGRLLSTCRAFMFCGEEDFGITPLEAQAHGTPVVAYARGAALETMDDSNAVFFDHQTPADVTTATHKCLARQWDAGALRRNVLRFAPDRFRAEMTRVVAETLATT